MRGATPTSPEAVWQKALQARGREWVVAELKRHIVDHCLPLWSREGWDAAAGGFVDRLHEDGSADRLAPRRVFVQARQIYCYAKAAQMGAPIAPPPFSVFVNA